MIKLIIFDLDGVLVEAKQIHYETLNQALSEVSKNYVISETEHHCIFDGLKTNQKLDMLTKRKGLPVSEHERIWRKKQELTIEAISKLQKDERLIDMMKSLRNEGFQLACCSNSIRRSVLVMLSKIGLIEYMDLILSNEDVKNSKPHPEIYWKAMSSMGVLPNETMIVEDSPIGLMAAERSHAEVLRVSNTSDLTLNKVLNKTRI
jgi:HAD superfamily hydrolase (TIGR01509 family)